MKTRIAIIIILTGILTGSCDLDEYPYGFYSDRNFYQTASDAESALIYAYNTLNFIEYSRAIFYIGELASETCDVKSGEAYGSQELNNWNTDDNNEILTYFFKYCYIGINRSNAIIENVANSSFEESSKKMILGEAYFLRAYHYFNLVRTFGLVPVQLEMVKTVDQTSPVPAKNLDEIYDLIISDLEQADKFLEIKRNVGRADKIAAQSLLAKVYLTIASATEKGTYLYTEMDKNTEAMYDSAALYSSKVLYDQEEYSLDTSLMDIYDVNHPDGPEHIFIMSMDVSGTAEGEYSKIGMMFHPWVSGSPYYLKNPDGSYTYCTNGWEVFQTTSQFYNSYAVNDLRRSALLVTEVYSDSGTVVGKLGTDFSYAFTRKYVDPGFSGQKSSIRPFLLRFSEVALIYAEAAGPTTEGYEWINRVRRRAGLPDLEAGLDMENFRNAVLRERSWELAFEGQRLYDLRRTASVTTIDPRAIAAGITEQQAAFYEIPQLETDLNPNANKDK